MTFESLFACPEALPLLLVGPAAWVALRAIDGWRVRRLARVVGPRVETLARDFSPGRRQTRRWLTVGALLLASVAALQPMWGEASSSVEQRGVDILLPPVEPLAQNTGATATSARLNSESKEVPLLLPGVAGGNTGDPAALGR